jgi:hypothetical protein
MHCTRGNDEDSTLDTYCCICFAVIESNRFRRVSRANGAPVEEEEIIVAGIGLICGWTAWVMHKTLIRPWRKQWPWFRARGLGASPVGTYWNEDVSFGHTDHLSWPDHATKKVRQVVWRAYIYAYGRTVLKDDADRSF